MVKKSAVGFALALSLFFQTTPALPVYAPPDIPSSCWQFEFLTEKPHYAQAQDWVKTALITSVVKVIQYTPDGKELSYGSGFLISQDTVVTAEHVVDEGPNIFVEDFCGQRYPVLAMRTDPKADVAVLYVGGLQNNYNSPLHPADPDFLEKGELLHTAGYGGAFTRMPRFGWGPFEGEECLTKELGYSNICLFATTAIAVRGNSGGPVLNERGEVVGILVMIGPGKTYFVPIKYALALNAEFIKRAGPNALG